MLREVRARQTGVLGQLPDGHFARLVERAQDSEARRIAEQRETTGGLVKQALRDQGAQSIPLCRVCEQLLTESQHLSAGGPSQPRAAPGVDLLNAATVQKNPS